MSVDGDPRPYLVLGDVLLPWAPDGYGPPIARPASTVEVLTPPSIVDALRAGYRPILHSSAIEQRA